MVKIMICNIFFSLIHYEYGVNIVIIFAITLTKSLKDTNILVQFNLTFELKGFTL